MTIVISTAQYIMRVNIIKTKLSRSYNIDEKCEVKR